MILHRYERPHSDYIEKLPKGKHSCKGMIALLEVNVYHLSNFKFALLGCIVCPQIYEALLKYMKHYWLCSGVGMTCPDPKGAYTTPDGLVIPMGKSTNSTSGHTSLLYNEYPLPRKFNISYS